MKNSILRFLVIIFITLFFVVGLVPDVNGFLKNNITYEQYIILIFCIVFIVFELILNLKLSKKMQPAFDLMESEVGFKKYKKEERYVEDKSFYYRNFPFDKNLFKIFWIAYQYNITKNRASILNALLLKWCKEGRIRFISRGKYEINDMQMDFIDVNEADLFSMLKSKSKNKFIKLNAFNSKLILKKVNLILLLETCKLKAEYKIITRRGKDIISSSIKDDVDIVFGLKNFLLNFSSIEYKSPEEVRLWQEYLIYAELFGIADEVKKEFKKANINYIYGEIKFNRVNRILINFIKGIVLFSYLFYGYIFIALTAFIWMLYIKLTWA